MLASGKLEKKFVKNISHKGYASNEDASVQINGINHIEIFATDLEILDAYSKAKQVDKMLCNKLHFSYSDKYGFLTPEVNNIIKEESQSFLRGTDMQKKQLPHDHGNAGRVEHLKEILDRTEKFAAAAESVSLLADASRLRIFWLLCRRLPPPKISPKISPIPMPEKSKPPAPPAPPCSKAA